MKKFLSLFKFRNIICFGLLLLIYLLPIILIKADSHYYESLVRLPLPFWVYRVSWILIGIITAIIFSLYKQHFKEKDNNLIRYGVRRFLLYIILNYLFFVALVATFFKANNLFLTYVLALSGFITSIFVLMEAILIKKGKAWWVVPLILWHLLLTVSSIYVFLYN